jgi:hypothetical protein
MYWVNVRQQRREIAESWIALRKALRACKGNYAACAYLRHDLRLVERAYAELRVA